MCPLCDVPVTMKHLIWECCCHEKPLPEEWQRHIAANEETMLWARGMVDSPDYRPVVGVDSLQVTGILDDVWPTRIGPSHRIAIGVKATRNDARVQRYAVAVTVGQWKEGLWHVVGTCTALAPGKGTEVRAWVFGCWLILQAILGKHQLNIPHRSIAKGLSLLADMWYNLEESEWARLSTLHVPLKLLKKDQGDQRAWLQFKAAQTCAAQRAELEAPHELLQSLHDGDQWHREVYEVAAARIEASLQDKDRYMHEKLSKVDPDYKVKVKAPVGRLEILQKLTQRQPTEGQHHWMLKGSGLQCSACGMNVKACSTHAEISKKEGSICAGYRSKTLLQRMQELVDASAELPEDISGHRWVLRANTFSCQRCWCKVARRCGKGALETLTSLECRHGQIQEGELQLRSRLHLSHSFWRRGEWVACARCNRSAKPRDGRIPSWMTCECPRRSGQQRLSFGATSSTS